MKIYTKKVFDRHTVRVGASNSFLENNQRGFTILELFVVVSIIAILLTLLVPALDRSRSRAQAIMCMNNYHHLGLAWTMYSGDNNNRLAYNQAPNPQLKTFAPSSNPNWVNNTMNWELSSGNTNVDFVNQSVLAPYANFASAIYRCPSDRFLSPVQRAAGWARRVRSVSMNALVGDPGNVSQLQTFSSSSSSTPDFMQFVKESDFRDPSSIFVFLDEHPDSIDDGYFQNLPAAPGGRSQWLDLPASYHNGGCSFSFADGHTEIHRWLRPSTIQPWNNAGLPFTLAAGDTADFDWVIQHTSTGNK